MSGSESDSSESMVFDPDQDPEVKRALRHSYRLLTGKIDVHQGNPSEVAADELLAGVEKADELFEQVKGPSEATLDSMFLLKTSKIGAQKARELKSGSGAFDIDDFVAKLVKFMGGKRSIEDMENMENTHDDDHDSDAQEDPDVGGPLDWERIGCRVMAVSRRAPVASSMLGPLSIEQKKKKKATRSKLEKNKEEMSKPQVLKEEDILRSENETAVNVAKIQNLLEEMFKEDQDPENINIFKFFVNPNHFAQSVENLFYLSFLIREGTVAFDIIDGEPVIFPCYALETDAYLHQQDTVHKRQMVFEFDTATWKRTIEVFDITEPMIPQRPKVEIGKQWYG